MRTPTRGLRWYFDHNDGRMMHKWLHYFEIYERHLAPFRGTAPRVLEIGVSHGGSLQMWRRYLGHRSRIVGIDLDPRVAALSEPGIDVLVGDQSDAGFLDEVADCTGGFDVVIDDGSHVPQHQLASLEALWPRLADGGVYIVEDLHSNYWPEYDGGRGRPGTFVEVVKSLIDDVHAFHSREPGFEPTHWTRELDGIHVYDSVVVLDKRARVEPSHRRTGRPAFDTLYGRPVEEMIEPDHRAQLRSLSRPSARLRRLVREPVVTVRRVGKRYDPRRPPPA